MEIDFHWQHCLHEAGHAAACIALGTIPTAAVATAHGGQVDHNASSDTDCAFVVAAGPIAQEILGDMPPPERMAVPDADLPAVDVPATGEASERLITAFCGSRGRMTDDRWLAEWAISGYESQPDRWESRIMFAHHVARRIVMDHRNLVLRIATELYERCTLSQAELTELST